MQPTNPPAAENPAISADGGRPRAEILFATRMGSRPLAQLRRSLAIARQTDASLRVLLVADGAPRRAAPPGRLGAGLASPRWEGAAAWVHRLAPDAVVDAREGVFADEVTNAARQGRSDLVIVPAADLDAARLATAVAHGCGCPLLVARRAALSPTIVAATDLRSPFAPVVRVAAALAARLGAPLVLVHSAPLSAPDEEAAARTALLDIAAARAGDATAVVLHAERAADAVLSEARRRGADTIAVGSHAAGSPERCTADEILDRARRSVLIMPLTQIDGAMV